MVLAPMEAAYTSNLFHFDGATDAKLADRGDPGERYHEIESVSDFYFRPSLELALDVPVSKRRSAAIGGGVAYTLHQNNRIADHFDLELFADYELTGRDTLRLELELVPRRFKKNYAHPASADPADPVYAAAYRRETEVLVRYDRRWSRRVGTRLEYELGLDAYESPFQNRDRLKNEGRAWVQLGRARRRLELGVGYGASRSPGDVEQLVVVDRSYRDVLFMTELRLALGKRSHLELEAEYRNRRYTTGVVQDTKYHERVNHRVRLGASAEARLGAGLSMEAFGGVVVTDTNRGNEALDASGYREIVFGLAAAWRHAGARR